MPHLGFWEIVLIVAGVALLTGARRLPEIGRSLGEGLREFKKALFRGEAESPPQRKDTKEE